MSAHRRGAQARRFEARVDTLLDSCQPGQGRLVVGVPEVLYVYGRLDRTRLLPLDFDFERFRRVDDGGAMLVLRGT